MVKELELQKKYVHNDTQIHRDTEIHLTSYTNFNQKITQQTSMVAVKATWQEVHLWPSHGQSEKEAEAAR